MYRAKIRIPRVSKCIPCIVDSGYVFKCIQHVFRTYGQDTCHDTSGIHSRIQLPQYTHDTPAIHVYPNVFRSAPPGYIGIQYDTRKSMYLPLGCLCAPRYALNTPKIRVSAPSLPAFTFFTCPGPPEEGLAPPPRRWSPARAEGFAPRPE